jgi:hypothetical protein
VLLVGSWTNAPGDVSPEAYTRKRGDCARIV